MTVLLEQIPHIKLGRHVEHDERSRDFAWEDSVEGLVYTIHQHNGNVLDQGHVGSCTGNAEVDALMFAPNYQTGRDLVEKDALAVYSKATKLDGYKGVYPPTDTGSSGLAANKAAKAMEYISSYKHAFSLNAAHNAIMTRPFITGTVWTSGMFTPAYDGEVIPTGQVVGGHEYCCFGYEPATGRNWFLNSWGTNWGVGNHGAGIPGGAFWMSDANYKALLANKGDVTIPIS